MWRVLTGKIWIFIICKIDFVTNNSYLIFLFSFGYILFILLLQGYYRDVNERSTVTAGACKRCQCSGHENDCFQVIAFYSYYHIILTFCYLISMHWINFDVFLFLPSRMKRVHYNANANEVIVDQDAKIWKAVRFVDSLKHILLFKFFSIEHIGMNYTSYANF